MSYFKISLIAIIALSASNKGCNNKTIAIYGYEQSLIIEGNMSRSDCDYSNQYLYLNDDYTFKIYYRKGRLKSCFTVIKEGNWSISNNKLILKINSESVYIGKTINLKGKEVNNWTTTMVDDEETFIKAEHGLKSYWYSEQLWEYAQGLKVEELFSKYQQVNQ